MRTTVDDPSAGETRASRSELELRAKDEQFHALIENLSSAVALIDAAGRFSLCNPRFLQLFGLPAGCDIQNVNDQRWTDWKVFDVDGRLLPFDEHPVRKAVLTMRPVREVVVGVRLPSGGDLVWMSVNAEPVLEDNGSIRHVICTYHDVTQLRRAEEALRTREREARERAAELEAVLGCVPDALIVYDRDGRIVRSNAAADAIFVQDEHARRATVAERFARAPYRAFDGDGRPLASEDLPVVRALRDGETVSGYTLRLRRDEQERVLRVNAAPLVIRGEHVGAVAFFDDVTERERSAEALRQSEAALDAFFAASPGILNIEDEEFRYVKTDAITPTYFGLTRETIVGKSVADLAPPFIEMFGAMMRRVIDTGRPELNMEVHSPVPSRPGEIAYWRASYFPVPLPGGRRGIGIMGVEITDLKKAEAAIRASESQLRELAARVESVREEEKARIARDLHDELGQLLTALRIDLEAIEDGLSSIAVDGPLAALLDRTVAASELLQRSIDAMYRVARFLRPASLDNLGLAEALRQECRWFEKRSPVGFEFGPETAHPCLGAEVDTALFRIAQEAFTNVVRHARASRVRVALEVAEGVAILRINDDGIGFDPAQVPFTSLGLVGMGERAHRLGGEVSVGRGSAGGTSVVARIPLHATGGAQS